MKSKIVENVISKHMNNELIWVSSVGSPNIEMRIYHDEELRLSLIVYSSSCTLIVSDKKINAEIGHYQSAQYPELKKLLLSSDEVRRLCREEKIKNVLQKTFWTKLKSLIYKKNEIQGR